MFMFKTRTEARNFKNGRDGYVVKDNGSGAMFRWSVVVPNILLASIRVFS